MPTFTALHVVNLLVRWITIHEKWLAEGEGEVVVYSAKCLGCSSREGPSESVALIMTLKWWYSTWDQTLFASPSDCTGCKAEGSTTAPHYHTWKPYSLRTVKPDNNLNCWRYFVALVCQSKFGVDEGVVLLLRLGLWHSSSGKLLFVGFKVP